MAADAETGPKFLQNLKLTDLLIAAPVFHLICASLFLIGYCWYFGGLIASFIEPSDIFGVSIGDIGPLYLFTLLPTIAYFLWMRARTGAWTSAEAVALKPEGPEREAAALRHKSDKKFFLAMMALMAGGSLLNMAISYFMWGYIPLFLLQTLVVVGFSFANIHISNKLDIASPTFQLIYLVGMALIYSCFNGMSRAQIDRRLAYSEAAAQRPACGQFVVLRKLSDHFLVISRDGKHALIDLSCKEVFEIRLRN